MDPPTYPFEETSFMDGPLANNNFIVSTYFRLDPMLFSLFKPVFNFTVIDDFRFYKVNVRKINEMAHPQ